MEISLLKEYANKLGLKELQDISNYTRYKVASTEIKEKDGLDPWCQWVTVHTGVDLKEHGIRELGEGERLKCKQIWEDLSERGIEIGVFGVMNAKAVRGLKYYCSDVWTTQGKAYPDWLGNMLEAGIYASQNYLELSKRTLMRKGIKSAFSVARKAKLNGIARMIEYLYMTGAKYGINIHTLTSAFEYFCIMGLVCSKEWKESEVDFLFINLIAHLQHQFWNPTRPHRFMEHGMLTLELIIQEIKRDTHVEDLIVLNGLEQRNIYGRESKIYRQRNPEVFMRFLGIRGCEVEQKMTNDCVYRGKDVDAAAEAYKILQATLIDDKALFEVKWEGGEEVFCRLADELVINEKSRIISGERVYDAVRLIDLVCERTGEHKPTGSLFSSRKVVENVEKTKDLYRVLQEFATRKS